VHYLSYPKPWQNPNGEMATDFWEIARRTPFYERLIQNLISQMTPVIQPSYPQYVAKEKIIVRLFKKILPKRLHPFAKKVKSFLRL
jgi:lipopolysaccharide biosynthesis glycosyltransferase